MTGLINETDSALLVIDVQPGFPRRIEESNALGLERSIG